MRKLFLATSLAVAIGLSACGPDPATVSEQTLDGQLDAAVAMMKDGTFARAAKVEEPNISNQHHYQLIAEAPMPKKFGGTVKLEVIVDDQAGSAGEVSLVFKNAKGVVKDGIGFSKQYSFDPGCDAYSAYKASCNDLDDLDARDVYWAAIDILLAPDAALRQK